MGCVHNSVYCGVMNMKCPPKFPVFETFQLDRSWWNLLEVGPRCRKWVTVGDGLEV